MPNKSRRIAARQAQLSGRGRRLRSHGPAGTPSAAPVQPASGPDRAGEDEPTEGLATQEPISHTTAEREVAQPRPVRAPRARARGVQVAPIETFFVPELRRIGIAFTVVVATLIALIVVLG